MEPPDARTPVVQFEDVTHQLRCQAGVAGYLLHGGARADAGPAGPGGLRQVGAAEAGQWPAETRLRHIRVFGEEIDKLPGARLYALRARIGMVFQESALFDSLNVEDNVAYRLHEEHVPEAEAHARVVEALKFVELEAAIDKFPSELSGGMRRRVSIARAIISHPDLILYDSPTGGLDPITSTTIIELVMKQRDVSHTTSLVVTHRLQDAFMLATHRFDHRDRRDEATAQGRRGRRHRRPGTKFLMLNEGNDRLPRDDGGTGPLRRSVDKGIWRFNRDSF